MCFLFNTFVCLISFCFVFSLQISDAFKNFGISDKGTCVLVAEIHKNGCSQMSQVQSLVQGKQVDLKELESFANIDALKKLYKISDLELGIGSLGDAIVSRIASKDYI